MVVGRTHRVRCCDVPVVVEEVRKQLHDANIYWHAANGDVDVARRCRCRHPEVGSMKLTILGSTAGTPSRTNAASGYLVEHEDVSIWMDAGTGTFMELGKYIDPGTLDGVVISHTHVDHCSDIFGLYGYMAYGPSGEVPIKVFVPEGGAEHLSAFARATAEHTFNMVLDIQEVMPGDAVSVGSIELSFGMAIHPVPALVTRVEADGSSLVYSGDTGPGSDLDSVASGTNVLLCEASIAGERDERSYPYHLTAFEAGRVAAQAGAGQLVVTHIGALMDPQVAVEEARTAFHGDVVYAAQGTTFDIEGG